MSSQLEDLVAVELDGEAEDVSELDPPLPPAPFVCRTETDDFIVLMHGSDEEAIDVAAALIGDMEKVELVAGGGTTGGATVTSATLPGTASLWASLPRRSRSNFLPILRPHVNTGKRKKRKRKEIC
uniref:Uncharacterized protein n=1 Tax=Anopheles melas TaxID=34690 RepID=A0A182U544_9DIPT